MRALDVIPEREERIGAERHVIQSLEPIDLLLDSKRLGLFGKNALPIVENVLTLIADINIDGVVSIGTLDIRAERQIQNVGALTQPPDVSFIAGKARAMDTRLLTGADADRLPAFDVADGV